MPAAGDIITVQTVPGSRIATTVATADSSTWTTTETAVMSVTAPLVAGRIYRVSARWQVQSTQSDDAGLARIREDSVTGAVLTSTRYHVEVSSTAEGYLVSMEVEFTAESTANKTFVTTGARSGTATGTHRMEAASNRPAYLYVDYIRDA